MEINNYFAPKKVEEAYELFIDNEANRFIAGGAWMKLSTKKVNDLISLDRLRLDYIKEENAFFEIGAMTSLRAIETNQQIKSYYSGILNQAVSKIMGVSVRNLATIGGSVMGKFAFSDLLGVLLVLDARLHFYKLGEISIQEFLAMKRPPRDLLVKIRIPKVSGKGYFKKVSKTHLDFSVINLAIFKGENIKIAVGSRPLAAEIASKASNFLSSQSSITDEIIENACDLVIEELKLSSNLRGSKEYRDLLVRTYLKRGLGQVMNDEN
jgi:CO/xanthine dehydrogenase FAD-binding subunit